MGTPSVRNSHWPQLRQTAEQYSEFLGERKRARVERVEERAEGKPLDVSVHKKSFQAAQQRLPSELQELLQERNIAKTYKKAGVESNQRASAATAWVVQHAPQWSMITMAWAGWTF